MKTIYLAGGCFWGTQKFFDQFDGVIRTEVGYANGPDEAPTFYGWVFGFKGDIRIIEPGAGGTRLI